MSKNPHAHFGAPRFMKAFAAHGDFFASAAVAPQGASRWHLNQIYCECEAFTVKLRRICRVSGKPMGIYFLPGRVPGRKYLSGCKCGICSPWANKSCAQQPAKICWKAPKGFFDSLNRSRWKTPGTAQAIPSGRTPLQGSGTALPRYPSGSQEWKASGPPPV